MSAVLYKYTVCNIKRQNFDTHVNYQYLTNLSADHVKRTDKINGRNVRARRKHTAGGCVFTVVRSLHMIPIGYFTLATRVGVSLSWLDTSVTSLCSNQRPSPCLRILNGWFLFLIANDIAADKRVPVFLSLVGGATYGLLRNLCSPAKPQDKSYTELTSLLTQHYEPEPLIIAERFHFHRRDQAADESISVYIAELRRLATTCKFDEAFLDESLRDRFVCGLKSEAIQRRLLLGGKVCCMKQGVVRPTKQRSMYMFAWFTQEVSMENTAMLPMCPAMIVKLQPSSPV